MSSRIAKIQSTFTSEDLERYRRLIDELEARLASASPEADVVWRVYSETEKLIAVLKFRTRFETPGVFSRLPNADDRAKLLGDAREFLSSSSRMMGEGDLIQSIRTLRRARNCLRSYLRGKSPTKRGERKVGISRREDLV